MKQAKSSLMWPASLFVSFTVHAAFLLGIGVTSGSPEITSGKAFTLVEFVSSAQVLQSPDRIVAPAAMALVDAMAATKPSNQSEPTGVIQPKENVFSYEKSGQPFYKSSEVSHVAQLQLPLEGMLFAEELTLSGRLVLDIAVSDLGKVVNIEVVEASDPSGALRSRMLPLLSSAPFAPAYKDGRPVNSIRRVEFTLGMVIDDPTLGFKATVPPGFRPKMDERGNVLKDQPKL